MLLRKKFSVGDGIQHKPLPSAFWDPKALWLVLTGLAFRPLSPNVCPNFSMVQSLYCVLFCGNARDWTQALVHARQVLIIPLSYSTGFHWCILNCSMVPRPITRKVKTHTENKYPRQGKSSDAGCSLLSDTLREVPKEETTTESCFTWTQQGQGLGSVTKTSIWIWKSECLNRLCVKSCSFLPECHMGTDLKFGLGPLPLSAQYCQTKVC